MSDAHSIGSSHNSLRFLRVPTIHGVVGHFVLFVLWNLGVRVDPDVDEEITGDAHEPYHRRVPNKVFLTQHSMSFERVHPSQVYQGQWMIVRGQIVGKRSLLVDEILEFGHVEFTEANHALL